MGAGEDCSLRVATRTAFADAVYSWGCREDPRTWDAKHVEKALKQALQSKTARFLADAILLLAIQLRGEEEGFWESEGGEGGKDGLDPADERWHGFGSPALFEPEGLGLGMEREIVQA